MVTKRRYFAAYTQTCIYNCACTHIKAMHVHTYV